MKIIKKTAILLMVLLCIWPRSMCAQNTILTLKLMCVKDTWGKVGGIVWLLLVDSIKLVYIICTFFFKTNWNVQVQ
jgi:hypothetical protein